MKAADRLTAIFFPNRCCGCGAVIYCDTELCEDCAVRRAHFSYERGCCKRCGQHRTDCVCEPRSLFGKAVFAFFYTDSVKHTVHQFKFFGKTFYGKLFAKQMYVSAVESGILTDACFVVPVPMHGLKKLHRGFNQTELLAREFSKISGVPYLNVLKKLTFSPSQHDLDLIERMGNVAGTFEVKEKYVQAVKNAKIILVDDVMTTHATMNEAAKTLLIFGADSVDALTVAAAGGKRRNRR